MCRCGGAHNLYVCEKTTVETDKKKRLTLLRKYTLVDVLNVPMLGSASVICL